VLGKSSLELGLWDAPIERERARLIIERDGALRDFPLLGRTASGELIHCVVSVEHVALETQSVLLVVIRDVSATVLAERARAELAEQLRHAQKMDALGSFAGGIAHDFNNILASIFVNAELLRMDISDEAAALEDLGELVQAAERAKDLVRRILTFSRKQPLARTSVGADDRCGKRYVGSKRRFPRRLRSRVRSRTIRRSCW
jgi:two-component system, cell cycle sensor histidine kinase and response regulator CckA